MLALPFTMAAARAPDISGTVADIITSAQAAMSNASSFHVLGKVNDNGTEAFNLSVGRQGGGGSIGVGGATLQIVVSGHTLYIKGDEKSWYILTKSQSTAQLVANKWIKVPSTNSNFSDFAELTVTKDFTSQILGGSPTGLAKDGTSSVNGRSALVLTDKSGDKLYIAASGTPYFLRIQGSGKSGSLTFSDFGDAPMPAVPSNAISLPGS